jgi:hypothetical protein
VKVRVWVDPESDTARIFDSSDMTVRACTPEEAAEWYASRSRTSTARFAEERLAELVEKSRAA